MLRKTAFASAPIFLLFSSTLFSYQQDWTQWRGPGRDGRLPSVTLTNLPDELERRWRVEVGEGHSSPVVAGGLAFVLSRIGEEEVVAAFRLSDGGRVWRDSYRVEIGVNPYATAHGKWPRSTPLWSGGKLYTLGITGILTSYDAAQGRVLWRRDFSDKVDVSKLFCGTSTSPLMDGSSLLIQVGDDSGGAVLALDPASGRRRWAWNAEGPGYASPIVATLDGTRQLVTLTQNRIVALDVSNGRLLWSLPFPDEWNENIVTPVVFENTLIFSGIRRGTLAIRAQRSGTKWTAREVWKNSEAPMYTSTPVLDGHRLYGLSPKRKGQIVCIDARDGKLLWSSPGRAGESASFFHTGTHLVVQTTEGEILVLARNAPRFEPLHRYSIADSPTWAHPAWTEAGILVKDKSSLTLWRME